MGQRGGRSGQLVQGACGLREQVVEGDPVFAVDAFELFEHLGDTGVCRLGGKPGFFAAKPSRTVVSSFGSLPETRAESALRNAMPQYLTMAFTWASLACGAYLRTSAKVIGHDFSWVGMLNWVADGARFWCARAP